MVREPGTRYTGAANPTDGKRQKNGMSIANEFGLSVHAVRLCGHGELIKATSGKIGRSENLRRYAAQIAPQTA